MSRFRRSSYLYLNPCLLASLLLALLFCPQINPRASSFAATPAGEDEAAKLISSILGPSSLEENLRKLTDEVGGRVPGTPANQKGVAWGVEAFRRAGVDEVHTEKFTMPVSWTEGATRLEVFASVRFSPRVVSLGWSPPVPGEGVEARVIDVGEGGEEAFARAGMATKGALLLVHTRLLRTWDDLFAEYDNAPPIIDRALKAGAAAILWMSTREHHLLYRHTNSQHGELDRIPGAMVSREDALRISRFVAAGQEVRAHLALPNRTGGPFEVENVVAEIRGTDKADEVVMLGAHLDSWELGAGALDNGCNSALVVEVARAVRASGIRPRRTLRFALWNGEEQGMLGSWADARAHRADLDRVVAYLNIDGGIGRITGFSVGGRKEIVAGVREVLRPIEAWGMNGHTTDVSSGTDHIDFFLEGVTTLDANQEEGNYIVNYHAASDTMDKVDILQLKMHAAYMGVTMVGIANRAERLGKRQSRAEVEALLKESGFDKYLQRNGIWPLWLTGERGRQP